MNWFKNLKLVYKINLINCSVIIITLVVSGYILLDNVYITSMNRTEEYAKVEAQLGANRVKREIEMTKVQLIELRDSVLYIRNKQSLSREEIIDLLKILLEQNPNLLGVYTIWEPDKFDGKDKQYANTIYHDKTGRFIPYVVRNEDSIIIEPLYDYEVEGIGDWYLLPKKTKEITLTEPFYYAIGGKKVLLTSLTIPILDKDGQFVGLVGADFKIDFLQKFIQTIQPLKGYSYLLSHKGTYIAHALRPEVIMNKLVIKDNNANLLETVRKNKSFMYFDTSIATGEDILRVFYPIHIDGIKTNWSLCVNIPKDVILANYYSYLRLICLALIISIIVLILLNIVSVSNIISKRLYYIVDVLNRLAKGNFDFVIEEPDSLDEIGDLQKCASQVRTDLHYLIYNLQTKEEELENEKNSLEAKVIERTEALIKSLERLQKANHYKDSFLTTMSHELRTPLNAIIGFGEILDKKLYGDLNEKQAEYTELILNSSYQLLDLIDDILDMAKIDTGTIELNKEKIDLHKFIQNIESFISSQFKDKGIEFTCSVDDRLNYINVDERKTRQIILNLLSNALKFTSEGGKVDLTITDVGDRKFKVSVSDTGIGINKQDIDKIFKEFYQLENTKNKAIGGVGIGLSIVKRFVEIQGGKIKVVSEPEKGSSFWFVLPIE